MYVICATIREQQAKRLIQNLLDTSACDIVIVVGLYRDIFRNLTNFSHFLCGQPRSKVSIHYEEFSPSFSYAVNAGWGLIRKTIGIDQNILAIATTDDVEFKPGWYENLLQCYSQKFPDGDGLMFLNDLRAEEMKVPNIGRNGISLKSAKFCDRYQGGWLESPYYHCNGLDLENAGLADLHGKCGYCKTANVYHLLVDFDKQNTSEQRLIALRTFEDRKNRGFIYDIIAPWRYFG